MHLLAPEDASVERGMRLGRMHHRPRHAPQVVMGARMQPSTCHGVPEIEGVLRFVGVGVIKSRAGRFLRS